jgi:uncharacterized protein YjbI with pentapeptide repeats
MDSPKVRVGKSTILNPLSTMVPRDAYRVEAGSLSGIFFMVEFERLNHYWGIYNMSVFVDSSFVDCVFSGTSFPDCRFVNCKFEKCLFKKDNVGGSCHFDDSLFVSCTFSNCEFGRDKLEAYCDFSKARFLDCQNDGSIGLPSTVGKN